MAGAPDPRLRRRARDDPVLPRRRRAGRPAPVPAARELSRAGGLGVEHLLVGHGEGLHGPGTAAAVERGAAFGTPPATTGWSPALAAHASPRLLEAIGPVVVVFAGCGVAVPVRTDRLAVRIDDVRGVCDDAVVAGAAADPVDIAVRREHRVAAGSGGNSCPRPCRRRDSRYRDRRPAGRRRLRRRACRYLRGRTAGHRRRRRGDSRGGPYRRSGGPWASDGPRKIGSVASERARTLPIEFVATTERRIR